MAFLSHPAVAVIILLGVLVLVHELGHFVVGRASGIAVELFSIGFGPPIFTFKRGLTEYRLSWVPLGGFVKFYGSTPTEEVPEGAKGMEFHLAKPWKRVLTVAAGPVANFLLAIFSYSILGYVGIPQPPAIIGEIMAGSPAEKAGLSFGDKVLSIDGHVIRNWRDLQKIIVEAARKPLNLVIAREGKEQAVTIIPASVPDEEKVIRKTKGQIGISPAAVVSVIALTDKNGIAAQAGLQNGDRIVRVSVGSEGRDIRFFREFCKEIARARGQGAAAVSLGIATTSPEEPVTQLAVQRVVELPISSLSNQIGEGDVEPALGLTHGLLLVYQGKDLVKDLLQKGDRITAWDGKVVKDSFQFRDITFAHAKDSVDLTVIRDGAEKIVAVPLKPIEIQKVEGKSYYYSLPVSFWGQLEQPEPVWEKYENPLMALQYGTRETYEQGVMVAHAVAGLFTGDMPLEALGGPISIAKVASDSVRLGWQTFLTAMALISINLGLLNLFPIPVLDGGQLVLIGAEIAKGRPLGIATIENFQKIGFVMVMSLVVMATYNDLSRFWTSMLEGILGMLQ